MKPSFLPKPLLFKEWKEQRSWLIIGFVVLIYTPLSSLFGAIPHGHASSGDVTGRLVWNALIPVLYHVQYSISGAASYPTFNTAAFHGRPAVSAPAAIASMGLMIALLSVERQRNTLWYTFSFPIRRADALRVKITLALCVVLGSFLLDFIGLFVCDFAAHGAIPISVLFQWVGVNLLISLSLMSIGLICGSMIQPGFIAGIATLLVAAFPWALGLSILRSLPTNTGLQVTTANQGDGKLFDSVLAGGGPTTPAGQLSLFLRSLSPTSFFSGTASGGWSNDQFVASVNWGHPLTIWLILWFICIIVLGGVLGRHLYLRAPIEASNLSVFPRLDPWIRWFYYGSLSFLFVNIATGHKGQVGDTPFMLTAYWFAVWLVIGVILTAARRATKRRSRQ